MVIMFHILIQAFIIVIGNLESYFLRNLDRSGSLINYIEFNIHNLKNKGGILFFHHILNGFYSDFRDEVDMDIQ